MRPGLRVRVIGALTLQPMSIGQVARCLSVHPETARESIRSLQRRGVVRPHGWVKGTHRQSVAFDITARA